MFKQQIADLVVSMIPEETELVQQLLDMMMPKEKEEAKFVTFQPGDPGLSLKEAKLNKLNEEVSIWEVETIAEGGQAQRRGINVGDVIKAVGYMECSDKGFQDAQNAGVPYEVAFEAKGMWSEKVQYRDRFKKIDLLKRCARDDDIIRTRRDAEMTFKEVNELEGVAL